MRVNISYSVELEEVPREIEKLLEECENLFRKMCGNFEGVTGVSILETIENLNDIRTDLKGADVRLEECVQILAGYVDIKNKLSLLTKEDSVLPPQEEKNDDKEL